MMKDQANNPALSQDLKTLGFTEKFLKETAEMKFNNLQEILAHDVTLLMNRKGYTDRWFSEFTDYLEQHDLLHLLKDEN